MAPIRVRFAPSPTGLLHVGGARTALFNWLFARHHDGTFVLRVEDTDAERNTPEANQAIFEGLRWLGLDWDEGPGAAGDLDPYRQSERVHIYDRYLQTLQDADRVYEEDGAIRFRGSNAPRTIHDLICGDAAFTDRDEPDMTIRRANGSYIFHFVSVVDDIEMGITHVIRGEDHLSNTPRHLDLYEAFGAEPPRFAHIPLILNSDGTKMSKRDQGAAIADYQRLGFHPEAVVNYLALLGWSPKDDSEVLGREALIERFSLEQVNRSNARFDLGKCRWLSGQYLKDLPATGIREGIAPFVGGDAGVLPDALLEELRTKLEVFSDAPVWTNFLFRDDFEADAGAWEKVRSREGVETGLDSLTTTFEEIVTWTGPEIEEAIEAAAAAVDVKKGALMFPCRVAVSGQGGGLSLVRVLEFLGKEKVVQRIRECIAKLGEGA